MLPSVSLVTPQVSLVSPSMSLVSLQCPQCFPSVPNVLLVLWCLLGVSRVFPVSLVSVLCPQCLTQCPQCLPNVTNNVSSGAQQSLVSPPSAPSVSPPVPLVSSQCPYCSPGVPSVSLVTLVSPSVSLVSTHCPQCLPSIPSVPLKLGTDGTASLSDEIQERYQDEASSAILSDFPRPNTTVSAALSSDSSHSNQGLGTVPIHLVLI